MPLLLGEFKSTCKSAADPRAPAAPGRLEMGDCCAADLGRIRRNCGRHAAARRRWSWSVGAARPQWPEIGSLRRIDVAPTAHLTWPPLTHYRHDEAVRRDHPITPR